MSDAQFDVVFRGVADGFDTEQVQARFAQLFSLEAAKVARLFATQQAKLKSNLSELAASQFVARLAAIGVHAAAVAQNPGAEPAAGAPADGFSQAARPAPVEPTPAESARPAAAVASSAVHEPVNQGTAVSTAFVFTGKGFEYFKIWIVNLLLSIVTLGIYSAWAKVRNLQYFYGNTHFNDSTFEYTAKPLQILKGRIIAFVLLIAYTLLVEVSPSIAVAVGVLFLIALPWIVVSSLRFNARNTTYHNIAFGFGGSIGGAAKAFIFWPLLGLLTLGLLMPWVWKKQTHYMVANHSYGRAKFAFDVDVIDYYKMIGIIIAACLLFFGLFSAVFGLSIAELSKGNLGAMFAMLPMILAYFAVYLLVAAYFKVTMTNIQMNGTHLVEHKFSANWQLGSYALLLLVNTLCIILTLGLFIPFAKVRLAAYKAEHTQLLVQGELDDFVASEKERVGALGEGVNDLFDVDVGI